MRFSDACLAWCTEMEGMISSETKEICVVLCENRLGLEMKLLDRVLAVRILLSNFSTKTNQKHLNKSKKILFSWGFHLRPEAGRFVRSFAIPRPVL